MVIGLFVLDRRVSRLEPCSQGMDARPGRIEWPLCPQALVAPQSPGPRVTGRAGLGDRTVAVSLAQILPQLGVYT